MHWTKLPQVLYVADFVVTDPVSMDIIRKMNIPIETKDRCICPDDACYVGPDIEHFIDNWFALHPECEEIPENECKKCEDKALLAQNRVPINLIGGSCGEKATLVSLAFDIDRLGSLEKVISEMDRYYQIQFFG